MSLNELDTATLHTVIIERNKLRAENEEYKKQTEMIFAAKEARLDCGDYVDDVRIYLLGSHVNKIVAEVRKLTAVAEAAKKIYADIYDAHDYFSELDGAMKTWLGAEAADKIWRAGNE